MSAPFLALGAREARDRIARREISPVELTRASLDAAWESQSSLNAFFEILDAEAMEAARAAEAMVLNGSPLGAIHGVPFSTKDLISVAGVRYAAGSRTLADNVADLDAPSVARARAAGGILIGKTTTSEFGCKAVGDSPLTGITRNPWDLTKTPGGSSGGAAASVAAGITPFALGTDGGGSIRIPASMTGLAGIKGHFGRVPVWPVSATPTLAHVGTLARRVEDAVLLLSAVAGYDVRDPYSVAGPVPDMIGALAGSVEGMRIAWSGTLGYAEPDAEVVKITREAAYQLTALGAQVDHVEDVFESDPADIWSSEFYAGVGTRLRSAMETKRDLLDPSVAAVLDEALALELKDYYSNVFRRYALRDHVARFFDRYDVLLTPVTPVASLDVGLDKPLRLPDRNPVNWVFYTYPFNLTGQPAASVNAGYSSDGMPVGIQVVGRALGEVDVVRVASAIEQVRVAENRQPPRSA